MLTYIPYKINNSLVFDSQLDSKYNYINKSHYIFNKEMYK